MALPKGGGNNFKNERLHYISDLALPLRRFKHLNSFK